MNIKHNLSNNLRYLREKKGLSLQQLSSDVGINKQSLYNYENNVSPSVDNISKLSNYFNVTVDSLIHYDLQKIEKNRNDTNSGMKLIVNDLIGKLRNNEQKNEYILKELEESREITSYTLDVLNNFSNSQIIDYLDLENSIESFTDLFSDITINIAKYPRILEILNYLNLINKQEDNLEKNKSLDKILNLVKLEFENKKK